MILQAGTLHCVGICIVKGYVSASLCIYMNIVTKVLKFNINPRIYVAVIVQTCSYIAMFPLIMSYIHVCVYNSIATDFTVVIIMQYLAFSYVARQIVKH